MFPFFLFGANSESDLDGPCGWRCWVKIIMMVFGGAGLAVLAIITLINWLNPEGNPDITLVQVMR